MTLPTLQSHRQQNLVGHSLTWIEPVMNMIKNCLSSSEIDPCQILMILIIVEENLPLCQSLNISLNIQIANLRCLLQQIRSILLTYDQSISDNFHLILCYLLHRLHISLEDLQNFYQ
jgi:hypothetical protein